MAGAVGDGIPQPARRTFLVPGRRERKARSPRTDGASARETALGQFWGNLGSSEGREWLEKGLTRSGAAPDSLRAIALSEAGFIAIFHLDPGATATIEEALTIYRRLQDKTGQALALDLLVHTVALLGNFDR